MWYLLLSISVLLGSIGQILFKFGAVHGLGYLQILFSPTIILGLLSYFLSALIYIIVLKHIPLSIAYPTISLSYIVIIILSHYFFGEAVTIQKIASMILIISGVSLLYIK
jgi:small multidrug resistance pump